MASAVAEKPRLEMPLTDAAYRLGLTYQQAHRLVLTRQLSARREGRAWLVDARDVDRVERLRNDTRSPAA